MSILLFKSTLNYFLVVLTPEMLKVDKISLKDTLIKEIEQSFDQKIAIKEDEIAKLKKEILNKVEYAKISDKRLNDELSGFL